MEENKVIKAGEKQLNGPQPKPNYGPENQKPQLTQLYDDLKMLMNERSHYREALTAVEAYIKFNYDIKNTEKNAILAIIRGGLSFQEKEKAAN